MLKHITNSEAETKQIAANLSKKAKKTPVLCLYGDLGCGKTVFTKGLAVNLGIPEREIKSPTYTFVREYRREKLHFYHFDFYRIEKIDDLMAQNMLEIFQQKNAIIVIEWPERIEEILPEKRLNIKFRYLEENRREIIIIEND